MHSRLKCPWAPHLKHVDDGFLFSGFFFFDTWSVLEVWLRISASLWWYVPMVWMRLPSVRSSFLKSFAFKSVSLMCSMVLSLTWSSASPLNWQFFESALSLMMKLLIVSPERGSASQNLALDLGTCHQIAKLQPEKRHWLCLPMLTFVPPWNCSKFHEVRPLRSKVPHPIFSLGLISLALLFFSLFVVFFYNFFFWESSN